MWTPEYFVRYVELPLKVDGVTIPNDDNTFDIYINALHSEQRRKECLQHELRHILRDHFYTEKPVAVCEVEAGGKKTIRISAYDDAPLPEDYSLKKAE